MKMNGKDRTELFEGEKEKYKLTDTKEKEMFRVLKVSL